MITTLEYVAINGVMVNCNPKYFFEGIPARFRPIPDDLKEALSK